MNVYKTLDIKKPVSKLKRVSIIVVIKAYICCSIFFTKLPFG